jgi:hypothetical protein
MTLDEIAYNILNLIRGGKSHHDESISLSQIKFNIKYYRAMFLRRDFARNGMVTRHVEQDLGCIEMEVVDASKCCNLPIHCDVVKSKLPIPKTVRFNFTDAITYVGAVDGITRIPVVEANMVKYLIWDKHTKDNTKAYMIEDYMYLVNHKDIGYVNIRGVFEDPEVLAEYQCDEDNCYDNTSDFPMPMDMVQMITQGIISGELGLISGTISDVDLNRHQDMTTPPGGGRQQQ